MSTSLLKKTLIATLGLFFAFTSWSQCNTNTTICDNNSLAGPFPFQPASPNPSSCLDYWNGANTNNYAYIILYITQGGQLNLLVNGNNGTGFLDVSIFNITGQTDPCSSLSTATEISCNYASASSGCAQFGTTFPCPASVTAPTVNTGDVIMILVEDWSSNHSSFTLELDGGAGSAQTGPPDATITPVGPLCDDDGPIQLSAVNMGGVWSGPGVNADGVFNPAAAGPGTHTINYAIGQAPCNDASSTTIVVDDCSTCFMSFFSTNIGACNPTDNTFEITGTIEFSVPPTTGQLIVSDCNGNQAVFNPPYTSPTNYTISGIDSDGTTNCSITAQFTADPDCAITISPFDYPEACVCEAEIGSFNDMLIGDGTENPWVLCFGDEVDIIGNGDFVGSQDFNLNGVTYDPGVWLLVYECPPTVFPSGDINTDPCLLGVASTADQAWTIANSTGSGNTLYYVPVTMYSMVDGIYAISINGGEWCYDLGPTYPVTFLPQIVTNITQDCQAATASVTVSGGLPAVNGSQFTGSNLSPANASFASNTVNNGGTFVINGLEDGDNWSFDIVDGNGCPVSVSGTFQGVEDPAFSYPTDSYCQDEPNPTATVTGTPGGTFTAAPGGLSINATTGAINLGASTPGTYTVTYTTPDPICFDSETFEITIIAVPVLNTPANATACLEYVLPAITGTNLTGNEAYYTAPNAGGTSLAAGDVINTVGTTTIYLYDETGTTPNCFDETSFTVTILPVIQDMTCPPALTATCDITEQPAYASWADFEAAGGSVTLPAGAVLDPTTFALVSEVSDGNSCPEVITRTYQVADECGIVVSCSQTITINDIIAPTGNAPADIAVQCIGDVPAADVNALTGVNDNCGAPTVTHVGDVSNGVTCPEVITRTYRIEDLCGNFIEVEQLITINDDTNPSGSAPADISVQCIDDVPAADIAAVTGVSDNCGTPTVTHVGDVSNGATCPEVITRTYRIEDECGNFIEVDQVITIHDDTNPTASNPAAINVACATDVPAPDITVVADAADNCTTDPLVEWVSDVSDNNVCNGEVITRSYSVTDDCGNSITVTQTITIDAVTPTFTLSYTDPTECGLADGTITLSNLDPSTTYNMEFNGGAVQSITTDATGNYVITGLAAGSYAVFTVSDPDCPACATTDNTSFNLVEPNAPIIDAGADQQVCEGTEVTLTATNPDGAIITWSGGINDDVAFTPAVGSTTYTVTANLEGCISSDQVIVTVYALPVIDQIADVELCDEFVLPAISGLNLTGGEAFYTAPNGGGTQLAPGDLITAAGTSTFYVYDETGTTPNCTDELSFTVTINLTPEITDLANVEICDEYQLPLIVGTNLTGNEAYYTAPNGGGNQLSAGDLITNAGANTIYIYDETVTTPNCWDETSFVVTINLTPELSPVANDEVCDEFILAPIVGNNLTGSQAYYTAPNGGGTQLNPGDVINTAGVNAIYVYDETGTTPNCFDETSFTVTINLTPQLDAVADVAVCDQFTFAPIAGTNLSGNHAYYTAPNGGGTQYNPGDVFTMEGSTIIYVYDETGTTPNCFDEVTFTINLSVTPTFLLSSTNPTECSAADGTITLSGLIPGITYSLAYTNNGAVVGPVNATADANGNLVINGLIAGSYSNFTVILNDCPQVDNTVITLVDPNAPFVSAGPDIAVCDGETIALTAQNPDGAVITWTGNIQDGVAFNQNVGTQTYTVTANLDNCISTDQVNVTVHPNPNVFAGNDFVTCAGQSVILTGSGASSYVWNNGITNGVAFIPTQTQTYTVIGTDANGCVGTDEVTVTLEELPVVNFSGDILQGCAPVTTTFTNEFAEPGSECIWYLSNGAVLTGCENVAYTFNQGGCYNVTLEITSQNGCSSSTTYNNYVCVQNYPVANFTYSPNQPTTMFSTVDFLNGSIGASEYQWFFGDGATSTEVNPTHTYPEVENSYDIMLVASSSFGCSDTAYSRVTIVEELIFYVPNTFTPDGDNYNEVFLPVFTSGFDPFDYHLMIFNRWGEIIFESYDHTVGWDGTYGAASETIVKDGTYIWKIEFKTKVNDERKMHVGHVNVLK